MGDAEDDVRRKINYSVDWWRRVAGGDGRKVVGGYGWAWVGVEPSVVRRCVSRRVTLVAKLDRLNITSVLSPNNDSVFFAQNFARAAQFRRATVVYGGVAWPLLRMPTQSGFFKRFFKNEIPAPIPRPPRAVTLYCHDTLTIDTPPYDKSVSQFSPVLGIL